MAELVLGKAGAAIGSLLPKELAFVGGAIGRLAGAAIDSRFLSPPVEGSRVRDFHLTEGREGAGIPVVYGRCRAGAQLIWAANFKERREVEGGKGGPRVADYSYTLSFAVALCEGEIATVSRCWANGEPFDLSKVTWRLYRGTEDQAPDPLIEAIEGADAAPAYRGVAYIVFEDLVVDAFGARMPQLSFEIVRPVGGGEDRLEAVARAVNIIPGSGEFALSTQIVRRRTGPGRETAENLHGVEAVNDLEASLDQLEAELPNVSRVNLVVAWFGSDLRCGECEIRTGVEIAGKTTVPVSWSVAGVERGDAYVVSQTDGRPNYGGTPSDASVRQAIALLKARGYHVTLYPFLLMDIPAGNGLPDPYGGDEQAAFPWRGRITNAAGDAGAQVAAFFAAYRSFVLHYAGMAEEEGADGILIGSELVGLTHIEVGGAYPAVEALRELAGDVRAIVGPDIEISYAADWTEYGGHVVGDDVRFPLDALWADEAISYVGLDWYPPMADWRDGEDHADAAFGDGRSLAYLSANIAGGEAFDWFYADSDARAAQERSPIVDGTYGEPWVFRQKDVASWWASAHHPRTGGVRSSMPTGWAPGMKPVRFVEMGCPAVDKGANQPSVFYDPKSSESALPHFSDGLRDDLVQRRAIEAFHAHWSDDANNPASGVYAGRMIPDDGVGLWAWDARPYPAFPALENVWSDACNWRLGHWLNGRVGLALLQDVVGDVAARTGAVADVSGLEGVVSGYRFDGPVSARAALEPLMTVYGFDVAERGDGIAFRMRGSDRLGIDAGRLVADDGPAMEIARAGLQGSQTRTRLRFVDAEGEYEPGLVVSVGAADAETIDVEAAVAMDRDQAQRCADAIAERLDLQRESARFAMAADGAIVETGDIVVIDGVAWRVIEVSDGKVIAFEAVRAGDAAEVIVEQAAPSAPLVPAGGVEPDALVVDAPVLPGQEDDLRPIGFAFAEPWIGGVIFSAGADATQLSERGRIEQPCTMGQLIGALYPHVSGRWQEASIWVSVSGAVQARSEAAVLNGANAALVETEAGWEMIQFVGAELVDVDTYKLTSLLRGQQGSDEAMAAGAPAGARIVFLTGAEQRLDIADWERGLELTWRAAGVRSDEVSWEALQSVAGLAGRPWSPAHLTATWDGGDLTLAWVRGARKGGDPWVAGEPPHEWPESYRLRITGGVSDREWDVGEPAAVYSATDQATDFPAGGPATLEVAQLGGDGEPGGWAGLELTIPAP